MNMTDEAINETLFVGSHMIACMVTALGTTFTGKRYIDDRFIEEVHRLGRVKYGENDWNRQMEKMCVAAWLKSGISEAKPDESDPEEQVESRPC